MQEVAAHLQQSRRSIPFFWPLWVLPIRDAQTYIQEKQKKTFTHIKGRKGGEREGERQGFLV